MMIVATLISAALLLKCAAAANKAQGGVDLSFLSQSEEQKSNITSKLINETRKERSLPILCKDDRLIDASRIHNGEMQQMDLATHEDIYGSLASGGDPVGSRLDKLNVPYSHVGENVAEDFIQPEEMVDAWMKSPEHMANIINKDYNIHGIARDGRFTTHTFAKIPKKVCTNNGLVDENLAQSLLNEKAKEEKIYGEEVEFDEEGNPILGENQEFLGKVVSKKRNLEGEKNFQVNPRAIKVGKMIPSAGDYANRKASDADFSCCSTCDKETRKSKSVFDEIK